MSAAQLDFYYDMDDDLGLSQPTPAHHHSHSQNLMSVASSHHSHLAHNLSQSHPQSASAAAYTTPDLYIYSNYPAHSTSHVTSDARDNRHFTPYSNSSSNASSTSVDQQQHQEDSPRSTQLLTQPIPSSSAPQVLTPTTSITSSALTTPTSTLTSPPTSATYPLPAMPRKRSVEFISHEISNSSGAPLVLSQPPKRTNTANKRHVSDVGLVPSSSSEPIYYYSNLVSPATETYDEYAATGASAGFDSIQEENHHSHSQATVPQTSHMTSHPVTSHPVMWNPAYTVLPSQQKAYPSRDRHNSDYSYDYGYEQMRRVSGSDSDSRKTSETGSYTSEPVTTSGFINYTQRDGPKLMTGVAPSGAQKTKQKREAEARRREAERREKEHGYY